MGAYISRCWNPPPTKEGTSGAPAPENGALAATSTQSVEEPNQAATTTQVVGPASPGAASPETAAPHAPAAEGVHPGSTTTPRVDTHMSFPISIADDDDGIPKGGAGGNVATPKPDTVPKPKGKPPLRPKPGEEKRRFRLPFGKADEE